MFTNKNKITTTLDDFDWRLHLANLDEKERQRQLREIKNRQQEIQNEFFELEKAMAKLTLLNEREEKRRKEFEKAATKLTLLNEREEKRRKDNRLFEKEALKPKITLLNERVEKRREDNRLLSFRRCGALFKSNQFVCGNKLNKSKGYVTFCGYHQNRNIVHILDDWRSHGEEVYWRERLI